MSGIITLLPVVVLLVVAITTKKTTSALVIGALVAFILEGKMHFLDSIMDGLYGVGMSADTVWLLLIFVFIGVFVGILQVTGVGDAMLRFIAKRVKSGRGLFLWTWAFALVLFIDDALRTTVLGQLTPLYDKYKIPRASFAYMVDILGVAFASLIPITSWAAFYQGVFGEYEELSYLGTPFEIYMHTIPFLFYAWIGIIILFCYTMGWIPKLGAMKKTYKVAEETGRLYSERSDKLNASVDSVMIFAEENGVGAESSGRTAFKICCFIGSIIVLTVSVFMYSDLLYGLIIADGVLIAVSFVAKLAKWNDMLDSIISGVLSLYPLMIIVFCAYLMRDAVTTLGMPDYIISIVEPFVIPELFPCLAFIICCVLTFTTGSNWGITAVFATVGMPLAFSIGADPILTMAAIINGAAFGSHVCFYTDMTTFVSSMVKIDNIEHALTQLPYGLIGGTLSAILFAVFGYVLV